jgi:hypothetical protein
MALDDQLPDPRHRARLFGFALAAVTLAVFIPSVAYDYVNVDDADYVSANVIVKQGLTLHGVAWAFRPFTPAFGNPWFGCR